MDFATGYVGRKPLISWQGLSEHLYVEPHPGMAEGRYSVNQARRANGWLVRRGLVEMRSNAKQWHLIFFLPLAQRGFFVSKKADSNPTAGADRDLQRENPINPTGTETPKPTNTSVLSISTYSTPESALSVDNLIIPASLTPAERANVIELLGHAPLQAQEILDELAGAIAKGAIRKGKAAFVKGCVDKAKAGSFTPDKGREVAQRRTRAAAVEETRAAQGDGADRSSKAHSQAAIAAVKSMLEKRGAA